MVEYLLSYTKDRRPRKIAEGSVNNNEDEGGDGGDEQSAHPRSGNAVLRVADERASLRNSFAVGGPISTYYSGLC